MGTSHRRSLTRTACRFPQCGAAPGACWVSRSNPRGNPAWARAYRVRSSDGPWPSRGGNQHAGPRRPAADLMHPSEVHGSGEAQLVGASIHNPQLTLGTAMTHRTGGVLGFNDLVAAGAPLVLGQALGVRELDQPGDLGSRSSQSPPRESPRVTGWRVRSFPFDGGLHDVDFPVLELNRHRGRGSTPKFTIPRFHWLGEHRHEQWEPLATEPCRDRFVWLLPKSIPEPAGQAVPRWRVVSNTTAPKFDLPGPCPKLQFRARLSVHNGERSRGTAERALGWSTGHDCGSSRSSLAPPPVPRQPELPGCAGCTGTGADASRGWLRRCRNRHFFGRQECH